MAYKQKGWSPFNYKELPEGQQYVSSQVGQLPVIDVKAMHIKSIKHGMKNAEWEYKKELAKAGSPGARQHAKHKYENTLALDRAELEKAQNPWAFRDELRAKNIKHKLSKKKVSKPSKSKRY